MWKFKKISLFFYLFKNCENKRFQVNFFKVNSNHFFSN